MAVKNFAQSINIELLFLPSYSLNLGYYRTAVEIYQEADLVCQILYAPEKLHSAIKTFFKNINKKHNDDLHNLLTLKFQFFDHDIAHLYAE